MTAVDDSASSLSGGGGNAAGVAVHFRGYRSRSDSMGQDIAAMEAAAVEALVAMLCCEHGGNGGSPGSAGRAVPAGGGAFARVVQGGFAQPTKFKKQRATPAPDDGAHSDEEVKAASASALVPPANGAALGPRASGGEGLESGGHAVTAAMPLWALVPRSPALAPPGMMALPTVGTAPPGASPNALRGDHGGAGAVHATGRKRKAEAAPEPVALPPAAAQIWVQSASAASAVVAGGGFGGPAGEPAAREADQQQRQRGGKPTRGVAMKARVGDRVTLGTVGSKRRSGGGVVTAVEKRASDGRYVYHIRRDGAGDGKSRPQTVKAQSSHFERE
jgi:hypothetical protein